MSIRCARLSSRVAVDVSGICGCFQTKFRPARRIHELRPAPIKAARVLFAGQRILDDIPADEIVLTARAKASLVVEWKLLSDAAAGSLRRVAPVFHIILLGHAGRTGIADVIFAKKILDGG